MKTKVKSVADLKRMALARGASLEVGGTKYNTTNEQVKTARAAESKPAQPEPKPQAQATPEKQQKDSTVTENVAVIMDMAPVAEAVSRGAEHVGGILESVVKQIQVQESKPGRWLFKINRDVHGRLETVEAIAR